MRILNGVDLDKTVLIDNCPYSALYQSDSLIPIIPWTDDAKDDQLTKLTTFLVETYAKNPLNLKDSVKRYFKF